MLRLNRSMILPVPLPSAPSQGVIDSTSCSSLPFMIIGSLVIINSQLMSYRKQVDPLSQEWSAIDGQLQLITGKSSLKIITVYRLTQDVSVDQDYKTEMVLQVTDFNKDYIEKVVTKTIPLEDIMLYCGHVNIHPKVQPNKVFTFLLGRVRLGRMGTPKQDPSHLDSILMEKDSEKDAFQYNFVIRSHSQYFVTYEVNFAIGDEREFNPQNYQCTLCQNKTALVFCRTEQFFFCEECSRDHHKSRLMQTHELEKMDKINTLALCKTHNTRFAHYCLKCAKYLCAVCLQKGNSHGSGDHPVYAISQLYEQKRESNEFLPLKQRDRLEGLLRALGSKREQVTENYNEVRRGIEQQFQRALDMLDQLMAEKTVQLNSDELQLRMMVEKLEWSKAFIKFQERSLKPIYYFQAQQRFEQEIPRMRISNFQSIVGVKADIAMEGQLTVGRRDVLDRSRRTANPVSARTEPMRGMDSELSFSNAKRTIYELDAQAQPPQLGTLVSRLQSSRDLNFFCFTK